MNSIFDRTLILFLIGFFRIVIPFAASLSRWLVREHLCPRSPFSQPLFLNLGSLILTCPKFKIFQLGFQQVSGRNPQIIVITIVWSTIGKAELSHLFTHRPIILIFSSLDGQALLYQQSEKFTNSTFSIEIISIDI